MIILHGVKMGYIHLPIENILYMHYADTLHSYSTLAAKANMLHLNTHSS